MDLMNQNTILYVAIYIYQINQLWSWAEPQRHLPVRLWYLHDIASCTLNPLSCLTWFPGIFNTLSVNLSLVGHRIHDDVIKWKHFPHYWPFVRGIHQWITPTKASDVELWYFLWFVPEQTAFETIETPVIWDAIMLIMMSL